MITITGILATSFGFLVVGGLGSLLLYGLEGHDLIPAIIISVTFMIFAFIAYELFRIGIKSMKEDKSSNKERWNDRHSKM